MGNGNLRVSVLVPTRNRKDLLRQLIESLWRQNFANDEYEIIVIDNCSTDGTEAMLAEMAEKSPCAMRYRVMQENRGPVHTRNIAARMAEAPILGFTDSDCEADPCWLKNAIGVFDSSPGIAMVSGAVCDKPGQPVRFFTLRNGAGTDENFTYPTCNVFYRREVFWELGGFDESVWLFDISNSPIECADTDFAWKVKESGRDSIYLRDAVIYHEVALVKPIVWLLYHTRLLVIPELVRRHPQLRHKLLLGNLFFCRDNILFYMLAAGVFCSITLSPWWLALALPYAVWVISFKGGGSLLAGIPRRMARIPVFCIRHVVVCGSLIYGSIRSRTLVL